MKDNDIVLFFALLLMPLLLGLVLVVTGSQLADARSELTAVQLQLEACERSRLACGEQWWTTMDALNTCLQEAP